MANGERLVSELKAPITAPVVEPYIGPAILKNRASRVFFDEIFGHRIKGHRQKSHQIDTAGAHLHHRRAEQGCLG